MVWSEQLVDHLVRTRLAGDVATDKDNIERKIASFLGGDPQSTMGFEEWPVMSAEEVRRTIDEQYDFDLGLARGHEGYISPHLTVAALARHARILGELVRRRSGPVVIATGHPSGLLEHYQAIAAWLAAHGVPQLAHELDGLPLPAPDGGDGWELREVRGVLCVYDGMTLAHCHLPGPMAAVLRATGPDRPALVLADHGFAVVGAQAGLRVASVSDVNDIGPIVTAARFPETVTSLPIDDNLRPRTLRPVTEALLVLAEIEAQRTSSDNDLEVVRSRA